MTLNTEIAEQGASVGGVESSVFDQTDHPHHDGNDVAVTDGAPDSPPDEGAGPPADGRSSAQTIIEFAEFLVARAGIAYLRTVQRTDDDDELASELLADTEYVRWLRAEFSGLHDTVRHLDVAFNPPCPPDPEQPLNEFAVSAGPLRDEDVARRRLLPVVVRLSLPSGTAPNDDLLERTRAVTNSVIADLASHGWPAPSIMELADGYVAGYACNLAPHDGGRFKQALEVLNQRHGGDCVVIDVTAHHAAVCVRFNGPAARTAVGVGWAYVAERILAIPAADQEVTEVELDAFIAGGSRADSGEQTSANSPVADPGLPVAEARDTPLSETAELSAIGNWDGAPVTLADFVGQERAKELIARILADHTSGRSIILLNGPSGVGKTLLARLAARQQQVTLHTAVAQQLKNTGDLVAFLTGAKDGEFVLIDELHKLREELQIALYYVLSDGVILPDGASPPVRVPRVSFWFATTDEDKLLEPLLNRIPTKVSLDFYSLAELATIVGRRCVDAGLNYAPDVPDLIAARGRGSARIVIQVLADSQRECRIANKDRITRADVEEACRLADVDALGLDNLQQRYLRLLANGPNWLNVLASTLGRPERVLTKRTEPLLLRLGLIAKDRQRRRYLTSLGQRHISPERPAPADEPDQPDPPTGGEVHRPTERSELRCLVIDYLRTRPNGETKSSIHKGLQKERETSIPRGALYDLLEQLVAEGVLKKVKYRAKGTRGKEPEVYCLLFEAPVESTDPSTSEEVVVQPPEVPGPIPSSVGADEVDQTIPPPSADSGREQPVPVMAPQPGDDPPPAIEDDRQDGSLRNTVAADDPPQLEPVAPRQTRPAPPVSRSSGPTRVPAAPPRAPSTTPQRKPAPDQGRTAAPTRVPAGSKPTAGTRTAPAGRPAGNVARPAGSPANQGTSSSRGPANGQAPPSNPAAEKRGPTPRTKTNRDR
jgi:Holliday junction DNA helicase RuvB